MFRAHEEIQDSPTSVSVCITYDGAYEFYFTFLDPVSKTIKNTEKGKKGSKKCQQVERSSIVTVNQVNVGITKSTDILVSNKDIEATCTSTSSKPSDIVCQITN